MDKGNGKESRRSKAAHIALVLSGGVLTAGLLWAVVWWGLGWHIPGFWWITAKVSLKVGLLVPVGLIAFIGWISQQRRR
ncbi:hypothetical protein GCM10020000_77470 [Streptomyces olivoverticillatus]